MFRLTITFVILIENVFCRLWPHGIVHYAVNDKDYDLHSREIIAKTLTKLQNEICVKFFETALPSDNVLYINNPNKIKNCEPINYVFTNGIMEIPIGYKCLHEDDLTRVFVDLLKASIGPSQPITNSMDLVKTFDKMYRKANTLLNPDDRNFINLHYFHECNSPQRVPFPNEGKDSIRTLSDDNDFYKDKLWPLGIVMYQIDKDLLNSTDAMIVRRAMSLIERHSCVIFQEVATDGILEPKSILLLGKEGEEVPYLGALPQAQKVNLHSIADGAAGHKNHAFVMLLRALGVPMMSNRYDRDNYVTINWKNIIPGKQILFEKDPKSAAIGNFPYDYESLTHAPANYYAAQDDWYTMEPIQDYVWQRIISMGHGPLPNPNDPDIALLNILYTKLCLSRSELAAL